jgi:hypothetical protein
MSALAQGFLVLILPCVVLYVVQPAVPATAEVPQMREWRRFQVSIDLVALPTAVTVARIVVADILCR